MPAVTVERLNQLKTASRVIALAMPDDPEAAELDADGTARVEQALKRSRDYLARRGITDSLVGSLGSSFDLEGLQIDLAWFWLHEFSCTLGADSPVRAKYELALKEISELEQSACQDESPVAPIATVYGGDENRVMTDKTLAAFRGVGSVY